MGAPFTQPVDIANRALQHLGANRIATMSDTSKQAQEVSFAYDKLRQAELRRHVWRFAVRRVMMRLHTSTTKRFIAPAWATSTSYSVGAVVQDTNGLYWVAMVAHTASSSNEPGTYVAGQPQYWQQYFGPIYGDVYSSSVTYNGGDIAYSAGSPDLWYISLINANLNNTLSTTADWTEIASTGTTDQPVYLLSPVGPSITINGRARNVWWLPNGYLRPAPYDPKVENASTLNTSAGIRFMDWEFENGYIVSANGQPGATTTTPFNFRFVGDVQDVTLMDPLFCEALAARMAFEMCETMTQSNVKQQAAGQSYQKFMHEARMVNSIETGNTEPNEEEYKAEFNPGGVEEAPAQQQR